MIHNTKINAAESIFLPFWDTDISPFGEMAVSSGQRGGTVSQNWCYVEMNWPQTKNTSDTLVASMEMKLDVDISGYDRLLCHLSLQENCQLSVMCVIDGKPCKPIQVVKGKNGEFEARGEIAGKKIEHIRIEITAQTGDAGSAYIEWVGLANEERLAEILSHPVEFDSNWEGFILPQSEWGEVEPGLGLYLDKEDLEKIRKTIQKPPYDKIMDDLRTQAHELCGFEVESLLKGFISRGDTFMFSRERDQKRNPVVAARLCAVVGMIDQNAELLKYAARCILTICKFPTWVNGPLQCFPRSVWHERSFMEATLSAACADALDYLDAVLTPLAKETIRYAIMQKGVARIEQDIFQHEYIHHCNQGILMTGGYMVAMMALSKVWPRAAGFVDIAEKIFIETLHNLIQEDGSYDEGPGYWNGSFNITVLYAVARYRNMTFPQYMKAHMGEKFNKVGTYISAVVREGDNAPVGSYYTFSDSGWGTSAQMSVGSILLYALAADNTELGELAMNLFETPLAAEHIYYYNKFLLFLFAGEMEKMLQAAPSPKEKQPFYLFEGAQVAVSRRQGEFGIEKLVVLGGKEGANHGHEDKGSFIFDVDGHQLFCDLGIFPYDDPRCLNMIPAFAHNTLTPLDDKGSFRHQINPLETGCVPVSGSGDASSFAICADVTQAWEGIFSHYTRRFASAQPGEFLITDTFVGYEGSRVAVHFLTGYEVEQQSDGFVVHSDGFSAVVRAHWAAEIELNHGLLDHQKNKVSRISILAEVSESAVLETHIHILKKPK